MVCIYLDYFLVILGSLVVEPAFFFLVPPPPRAGFLLGGAAEAVSFDFAFGLQAAAAFSVTTRRAAGSGRPLLPLSPDETNLLL